MSGFSAFAAAAAPLALIDLVRTGLRIEPIGIWGFAYLLVSFVWFVPSSQSAAAWQQVQTRVLAVGFLLLATYLFSEARARRAARAAIVASTLLAVALNLYEVAFPMTFSDIPGRAAGLADLLADGGASGTGAGGAHGRRAGGFVMGGSGARAASPSGLLRGAGTGLGIAGSSSGVATRGHGGEPAVADILSACRACELSNLERLSSDPFSSSEQPLAFTLCSRTPQDMATVSSD